MATIRLRFNSGTDTETRLELALNAVVIDHTLITRARLQLATGQFVGDSANVPAAWDFTNSAYVVLRGGQMAIPPGVYGRVALVTHDVNHDDGIAWPDLLQLTVI